MWSPVECGSGSPAAPCARGKHSATLLADHLYVLGGRGAGGALPLRDFWRYSLATGLWERLQGRGEPPPALQEHSATAHDNKLYVFGGEATALSSETPLWIYDTETQYWRKLPGQAPTGATGRRGARGGAAGGGGPSGRRGHSAHALKDCLLIYGGYKDLRGSTNELWAFHYERESWQAVRTRGAAGPARHRHGAALHGARLYVHAGQCDLRACSDLWTYDTISRMWSAVRCVGKLSPGALCGAAAARAGAYLYVFGGDLDGHANNDMWRFHFATETWERITPGSRWPGARVDGRAVLAPRPPHASAPPAPRPVPAPRAPPTLLARLSSLQVRRAPRCAYSALGGRDSAESLPRDSPAVNRSRSAHLLRPDARADSDSEPEPEREAALCKSASVRFTRRAPEEEEDFSTSDYASLERVNSLAFSNPHYLGPDVRALHAAALTPDSGMGGGGGGAGGDIELRELRPARGEGAALHLLLVGGREPPHAARLQGPLSMWTCSLP